MPTKKPSKPSQSASNPSFRGFINIPLTEDLKSFIKNKPFSDAVFVQVLLEMTSYGFKFTLSHDDYQHCFQCIGTRQDKEHPDYGILLTGRGSTPAKAFKQWHFIATEIIGETPWSEMLKPPQAGEYDD